MSSAARAEPALLTLLERANLYQGQKCTQDAANLPGGTWGLLDLKVDNRACHRFERTSTS